MDTTVEDHVVVPAAADDSPVEGTAAEAELMEQDLLVEDVSIDGMCGVY